MHPQRIFAPAQALRNRIDNALEDVWFTGNSAVVGGLTITRTHACGEQVLNVTDEKNQIVVWGADRSAVSAKVFDKLKTQLEAPIVEPVPPPAPVSSTYRERSRRAC